MKIVIEENDFQKLSEGTRAELIGMFIGDGAAKLSVVGGGAEKSLADEDETEILANLTPFLMKKFMDGVSNKTKDLLRIFAENDGTAWYEQLIEQSKYDEWRQLNGFFSGVTRRVRRIMQDKEAYLILEHKEVFDDAGKFVTSEHYMSKESTESLKKYFKITE